MEEACEQLAQELGTEKNTNKQKIKGQWSQLLKGYGQVHRNRRVRSQKFGWHNYQDPQKLNYYNENIESLM